MERRVIQRLIRGIRYSTPVKITIRYQQSVPRQQWASSNLTKYNSRTIKSSLAPSTYTGKARKRLYSKNASPNDPPKLRRLLTCCTLCTGIVKITMNWGSVNLENLRFRLHDGLRTTSRVTRFLYFEKLRHGKCKILTSSDIFHLTEIRAARTLYFYRQINISLLPANQRARRGKPSFVK